MPTLSKKGRITQMTGNNNTILMVCALAQGLLEHSETQGYPAIIKKTLEYLFTLDYEADNNLEFCVLTVATLGRDWANKNKDYDLSEKMRSVEAETYFKHDEYIEQHKLPDDNDFF